MEMEKVELHVQPVAEKIQLLRTKKGSLACVIDPSGHVLAKLLDEESRYNDVGFEAFGPYPKMCIIRRADTKQPMCLVQNDADSIKQKEVMLTERQNKRIREIITSFNGNALHFNIIHVIQSSMLRQYWVHPCFEEKKLLITPPLPSPLTTKLDWVTGIGQKLMSPLLNIEIGYNFAESYFLIERIPNPYRVSQGPIELLTYSFEPSGFNTWVKNNNFRWFRFEGDTETRFPHIIPYAAEAHGRTFDMSQSDTAQRGLIPKTLKALYGEYDVFEYFDIDDALLFLEENRITEAKSELSWTLIVLRNPDIHEKIRRVISNNPNILEVQPATI